MSITQLKRLAGVLGAALVLWALLAVARRPVNDRSGSLALAKIDTAAVDTIAISKGHDTAMVVRTTAKQWRVNGYPAASSAVTEFLKAVADTSRWSELVAESRGSHARLGVDADSGQHVRVVARGRAQLDVIAGKRTSDYAGAYVRRPSEDAVYSLHGSVAEALGKSLDDWPDKHVASIPPDSVAAVEIQRGASVYTLRRGTKGASWAFASGAPADSAAVANLLDHYHDLNAAGLAKPAQAGSLDFKKPTGRARLMNLHGGALAQLLFDSTATAVWARADTGGAVFRFDSWTWNGLAPAESTLKAKKKTK